MAGRLQGKVALITGSGGDIARAIATRFAREGAQVVGTDIDAGLAAETLSAVRSSGGAMDSLHPLDLSREEEVERLRSFVLDRFGGLDILCNNAKAARAGSGESTSVEDWRFNIDRNLTLPWLVTRAFVPALRAGGRGSIIFLASVSGAALGTGYPGNLPVLTAYSTAKAGILRLSVALANELGPSGIRVNCISPGIIRTRVAMRTYGEPGTPRHDIVARAALLPQTLGRPEDIANGALFLASDEASWITGHDLRIDGGWGASGGAGPARWEDVELVRAGTERPQTG